MQFYIRMRSYRTELVSGRWSGHELSIFNGITIDFQKSQNFKICLQKCHVGNPAQDHYC